MSFAPSRLRLGRAFDSVRRVSELVELAPPAPVSLDSLVRVARGARVRFAETVWPRIAAAHAQFRRVQASDRLVYGVNTGCGPLCEHLVPAADVAAFQANLVRSHASGLGPAHGRDVTRATLAVRALTLAQGRSGVRRAVVETLVAMLDADICPRIPEIGSVGASGDLVELAHVALAVMGEGSVLHDGCVRPAAEALAAAGLRSLVLEGREGLALMNGTACETGQAALVVVGGEQLLDVAEGVAALVVDVFGGSPEAFDARLHAVRPHAGQVATAAHMARLLTGSRRVRAGGARGVLGAGRAEAVQDPYTLRCVPQVLGAVRATLAHVRDVVTTELNAVGDNPTFFPEEDAVLHGGNFHGQPLALAVDHAKVALAEIALFSERRLARLLDPATNGGLPPFLIRDRAGTRSGLMGLQYCASSSVAENGVLAHPATLGSVPTNANNQDVVPMGSVGVRQARRILDNACRVVAIELVAAAEAADLVGSGDLAPATRALHEAVRRLVPPLTADRPLGDDVERLVTALPDLARVVG
jgi:histidine ammonia-lyase